MKKIIVLDTEGMSSHNPYNIGYVVADRNGNVYLERNFAYLPAIIENVIDCEPAKELVIRGASEILETEKYYYVKDKKEILDTLRKDIIENKVSDIWAYNCSFDSRMLNKLFGAECIEELGITFKCIWSAIVYSKLLSRNYFNFIEKNNYLTEKGNPISKAEIVYRYLFDENDFIEEHTALEDSKIELSILLKAFKSKKKLVWDCRQPWRVLKEKYDKEKR